MQQFANTLSTLRLLHHPELDDAVDISALEPNEAAFYTTPTHADSGIFTLLL